MKTAGRTRCGSEYRFMRKQRTPLTGDGVVRRDADWFVTTIVFLDKAGGAKYSE